MNSAPRCLLSLAAGALLAAAVHAQSPVDPPPWWRVVDDKVVSLFWDFSGPTPLQPTLVVAPPWYQASVTQVNPTPNLVFLPTLTTHTDVLALLPTGAPQAAAIDATIDNDPYPDYIKIFTFQYDAFEGAAGSVRAAIEQSLSYKRAIVSETSVPIGGGWNRVTIQAQLIPQPDDEGIDWSFLTTNDTVAIDNLFVSSKCVKPAPDETGDALGEVEARLDLGTVPGAADCHGVVVVEGPPPAFTKQYILGQRASTALAPHVLLRVAGSPPQVIGTIPLGATPTTAPLGPGDLALETRVASPGVVQQIVWVVLDRRANGQPVLLQGVDVATGTVTSLPLLGFPVAAVVPTNKPLGLAFDPTGEFGNGTFWVSSTDQGNVGTMREFSRSAATPGALIDTRPLPPECRGLAYDDTLGNFYAFSRDSRPSPSSPIEVNGFEVSGYDFQPTGTRFCGDLTIPNGGGPRGGSAASLEVYRSRAQPTAQLNLVCLVDAPNSVPPTQWIYELAGPFGFGWSVLGRCRMKNTGPFGGVPFLGSTMEVSLTGVPNSLFAMMFLGFSNTSAPGIGPLPLNLQPLLGWPESVLSVSPDVSTPLHAPTSTGEFTFPVPIPPAPVLGYAPVFFQWLALDTGIPGGFAMSQGGKTVLYP
jgi:hypothetical protein